MFTIYKITSPENKVYIGCTSQSQLNHRFGIGGSGYINQKSMWDAIQRFGWNNFTHEVLERCDSRDHASERERYYINLYDATNPEKGYNTRAGGLGAPLPPVSSEVAKKISEGKKGSTWMHKGQECRMVFPDKIEQMLADGWEFGGRPLTEAEKEHLRELNTGKRASDETRAKLSAVRTGKKIMHKGDIEYRVAPEDIEKYLAEGYVLGRSPKANQSNRLGQLGKKQSEETKARRSESMLGKMAGRCQIHKGDVKKLVPASEVEAYLQEGWERGVGQRKKR